MFEYLKENKRFIYIIIVTIILFIVIAKGISSCSYYVVDNLMNEDETKKEVPKLSMYKQYEAGEVLKGIAKKNGDWSTYPLSKKFLEKYNSKDGIFPQYIFTDVEYNTMRPESYTKNNMNGKFWYYLSVPINRSLDIIGPAWNIEIEYYLNDIGEIDYFNIVDEKQTKDEDGYPIKDWEQEITIENFYQIINNILFYNKHRMYLRADDPYIEKQPVTSKLLDKIIVEYIDRHFYPTFIDFFSNIEFEIGSICIPYNETLKDAFEKQEFYVCCKHYNDGFDYPIEDFVPSNNYLYKVNFILDRNNQLDDVYVYYIDDMANDKLHQEYIERIYTD